MTTYLTNVFSLNMLSEPFTMDIRVSEVSDWVAAQICRRADKLVNAIGHADTDGIIRGILTGPYDKPLPVGERLSVSIDVGDTVVVGQYSGPRLPEGATALPEGATIKFMVVQVLPRNAVNLMAVAQLEHGPLKSVDSGETDMGGWPISGTEETTDGKVVGGWGPTFLENTIVVGGTTYYC